MAASQEGAKVWVLEEATEKWHSGEIVGVTADEKEYQVILDEHCGVDDDNRNTTVPCGSVHFRNPDTEDGLDDMNSLSHLHTPALLHNLRVRYNEDKIYTYTGRMTIAVNPYKWLPLYELDTMDVYRGVKFGDLPPHVFATADAAYEVIARAADNRISQEEAHRDCINQSILVSGESGAGKTETTKIVMKYLTYVGAHKQGGSLDTVTVAQQVLESNPLLEAFGNAKTVRNDNSSRFGKFIEMQFDSNATVVGAVTQTYLLEKSRVVSQAEGERNYHIFYQLLSGCEETMKEKLGLRDATEHVYTKGGLIHVEGMNDSDRFRRTTKALRTVGFSETEEEQLFGAVASVLQLGDVVFAAGDEPESSQVQNMEPFNKVCELLELDPQALKLALCNRSIVLAGETLVKPLTPAQANDNRQAFAKHVYSRVFDWIVARVNGRVARRKDEYSFYVGILDIFGFESFALNSFEQLCINYTNERLQQQFTHDIFKTIQDEYEQEGIPWSRVDFVDNQECLDLLESKLGVLSMLDEECMMPKGSDMGFAEKLTAVVGQHAYFEKPKLKRNCFTVRHYAGGVMYTVDGFLEKNRDSLNQDVMSCLTKSRSSFVKKLFEKDAQELAEQQSNSGSVGRRKSKLMATVANKFKSQLLALAQKLSTTTVQYIRCIKPNQQMKSGVFEETHISAQLTYCGVLEVIRISRVAFPHKMPLFAFRRRFSFLTPGLCPSKDDCEASATILGALVSDETMYEIGNTRVYFRPGCLEKLEELLRHRMSESAVFIQKHVRCYMCKSKYRRMRKAAVKVQSVIRMSRCQKSLSRLRRAALSMQCWARVSFARRRLHALRRDASAVRVQKVYKGHVLRKAYLRQRRASIKMQSAARMFVARRRYVRMVEEAREQAKLENQLDALKKRLQEEMNRREEVEANQRKLEERLREKELVGDSEAPAAEVSSSDFAAARPEPPRGGVAADILGETHEAVVRLQKQLHEAQRALATEVKHRKRLEDELRSLRSELDTSRARSHVEAHFTHDSEKKNRQMQREIESLKQTVEMYRQHSRHVQEVERSNTLRLEQELKNVSSENKQYTADIFELTKRIKISSEEADQLRQVVSSEAVVRLDLEQRNESLRSRTKYLEGRLAQIQSRASSSRGSFDASGDTTSGSLSGPSTPSRGGAGASGGSSIYRDEEVSGARQILEQYHKRRREEEGIAKRASQAFTHSVGTIRSAFSQVFSMVTESLEDATASGSEAETTSPVSSAAASPAQGRTRPVSGNYQSGYQQPHTPPVTRQPGRVPRRARRSTNDQPPDVAPPPVPSQ
eukprot:Rmarinus@m.12468